ncbi:MAG: acetolactate synthase small subunit [Planctomycetota bacterium]|jgi:acetolactate synthase-1/3 small subunit|nr:acetolactate synthase small subunit [Planctomycetota bacterium]
MTTASPTTNLHTISLHVRNKPGALVRISLVFSRRGFNIESLVVSPGKSDDFSRMTITSSGDPETLEQVVKQLTKLVDVVHAIDHTNQPVIDVEIGLFKVKVELKDRTALLQLVEHYHGKVVDYGHESVIIRVSGNCAKLDAMEELLKQWEILELVRSGKIVMARGLDET